MFIAFGVKFDKTILQREFPVLKPIRLWLCCQALALSMGLPRDQEQLCKALNLDEKYQKKDGRALIHHFGKPAPKNHKVPGGRYTKETSPDKWVKYREYGGTDTEGLRECWHRIPKWNYRNTEIEVWYLDQIINERGLLCDTELASAVTQEMARQQSRIADAAKQLTAGVISNVTQRNAMLAFFAACGLKLPDLTAETVKATLARDDLNPTIRELLKLRQAASMTSVSKFTKLLAMAMPDDHARGLFGYWVAHTGRAAGEGIQVQNLKHPLPAEEAELAISRFKAGVAAEHYANPLETASKLIRYAFIAEPGTEFGIVDFSNVEGRGLAWLAGEIWKLKAYAAYDAGTGPDVYALMYAKAFGVPIEAVGDEERKIGKVLDLACGYQGWENAVLQFAGKFGLDMAPETAIRLAGAWRDVHPATVKLWKDVEFAVRQAILTKQTFTVAGGKLKIGIKKDWLLIRLPSGRFIAYYKPALRYNYSTNREEIVYWGRDSQTKTWRQQTTYGGKLVENCVQGIGRCLLMAAMLRLHKAHFDLRLHVHDEAVCQLGDPQELEIMLALMKEKEPWASDLPINATGDVARSYKK